MSASSYPLRVTRVLALRSSACAVAVAVVALAPVAAPAQPALAPTLSALIQLATALEGAYGDEGAQVTAALDAMTRAGADWDRDLAAVETRTKAAGDARAHADLAVAYLTRGRIDEGIRTLEQAIRLDPMRVDTSMLLGVALWKAGRSAEAVEALRRAWSHDRQNPILSYWLMRAGAATLSMDEREGAMAALTAAYRTALTLDAPPRTGPFVAFPASPPDMGTVPLMLPAAYGAGYARFLAGDVAGAVAQFREAAQRDPLLTDPVVDTPAMQAGSAALRQGRIASAREHFRAAVALAPESSEAHRLLGIAYLFDFEPERSAEEFEAAVRLRPQDERSRVLLGRVLMQLGHLDEAETVLRETARAVPPSMRGALWLGSMLTMKNQDEEAAAHMMAAANGKPIAGEASLFDAIGSLLQKAGDPEAAGDAFLRSILANPNRAAAHVLAARAHVQQDQPDQAFAEYVAALLVHPREANAYMGIGQLYLDVERYADAVTALERLVTIQPTYSEGRYALGTALRRAGREADAARELAEFTRGQAQREAERRRTMTLDVLRLEATVRTNEGAYAAAEDLWNQILALEPTVAAYQTAMGSLLVRQERFEAALPYFERAAELGGGAGVYRLLASTYARVGRQAESVTAREKYERALLAPTAGAPR